MTKRVKRQPCRRCGRLVALLEALLKRYLGDAGDKSWQDRPELRKAEKAVREFKEGK